MSNPLKKLAGQTAIYGLSSIVGRFLNFLLTPLYAYVYAKDQFGIITEMYAYVAFLIVLLTYGLETAYFRFSTLPEYKERPVYSSVLASLCSSTAIFIATAIVFAQDIANWLHYPDHREYVVWFAIIIGLDAISSIPLAKLRADKKAVKFAMVNMVNIGVNIGLNIFFLVYCRNLVDAGGSSFLTDSFYNPEIGVGYVFIANLIASISKFLMLSTEMSFKTGFEFPLWKKMLNYAYPMLFVGLAGIVNETIDRIMIKKIIFNQNLAEFGYQQATTIALEQNGIYGANYKLAMIISLFIQAFRYAAEPFFFKEESKKNAKETYVKVMDYFLIVVIFMYLVITLFLSLFKYFIPNEVYWEGLQIVPVLLAAYVCLGVYYNLSIWYKLSQKTGYGAIISIVGALITIGINLAFIPKYGYIAAAWATFICYFTMMIISYLLGHKHYPIPYNIKKGVIYVCLAIVVYCVAAHPSSSSQLSLAEFGLNTGLLLAFLATVFVLEKRANRLSN